MTPASAVGTRSGRIVFLVGGGLFVLAGLVAIAQTPLTPVFEWAYRTFGESLSNYQTFMWYGGRALSAAAVILFAVGTRGGGSVVARRPVGVIALLVFVLWPIVPALAWTYVPYEAMAGLPWPLSTAMLFVGDVAGLVGVLVIVRVRSMPGGWRWLPLAAYLVLVVPPAFGRIAQDLGWNNGVAYAPIVIVPYAITLFTEFIVPFVLGFAAIGLALVAGRRARRDAPAGEESAPVAADAPPAV